MSGKYVWDVPDYRTFARIVARYNGYCNDCPYMIKPGDVILYDHGISKHEECPDEQTKEASAVAGSRAGEDQA